MIVRQDKSQDYFIYRFELRSQGFETLSQNVHVAFNTQISCLAGIRIS